MEKKQMEDEIKSIIRMSLNESDSEQIFNSMCNRFEIFYSQQKAHTISDFKKKSKKQKGDLFEVFCQMYLINTKQFKEVWLLKEVPEPILHKLGLARQDVGIDLICQDLLGDFTCVQAKYRRRRSGTKWQTLNWETLSTFLALCARTGPYFQYIVMTTAKSIRMFGRTSSKDVHLTLKDFENTKREFWREMLGSDSAGGQVLLSSSSSSLTVKQECSMQEKKPQQKMIYL